MMLEIFCDRCKQQLQRPGALVFSPPPLHENGTKKYHVFVTCWRYLYDFVHPNSAT